jgi:hypothetical protein
LTDDLEIVLALQELGDASTDDLVIVEQEHGDGHTGDAIDADSARPDDQVPDGRDFRPVFIGPSVRRAGSLGVALFCSRPGGQGPRQVGCRDDADQPAPITDENCVDVPCQHNAGGRRSPLVDRHGR